MEITLKYGTAIRSGENDSDVVVISSHNIFVVMAESTDPKVGKTFYGFRIGLPGACPWAFLETHVRELTEEERRTVSI